MTVVLFTGTIATVSNEIDWLLQHDMRVVPDGEKVSWGEMEDALRAYRPEGQIVTFSVMEGDHFAYRARVTDPSGHYDFVHVDQWRGEVTGETHALTVQRFFRDLHRYLFMPNFIGLPLVTSLAFVLAVSLYTGLKTARNWKTLMFRLRTGKGARVMIGDAHKAAGIWASWFFVVIIVTSVWYLFEFGSYIATRQTLEPERPGVTAERAEAFGAIIEDRPLDEVVAAAQAAFPELKVTEIQYPRSATGAFIVLGRRGNPALRQRANRVFLDPESLEVIKVQRSEEIGALAYLNEMADPLHFGFFGGLPTKLVWFVFGTAMTGLSVTGVWLTWRRLRQVSPSKAQLATFPVLIVSFLFFMPWYARYQAPAVPVSATTLGEWRTAAGVIVTPSLDLDADGAPTGRVRIRLSAETGRPQLAGLSIGLGDAREEARPRPSGPVVETTFTFPEGLPAKPASLSVTVTAEGTAHTRLFPLRP